MVLFNLSTSIQRRRHLTAVLVQELLRKNNSD